MKRWARNPDEDDRWYTIFCAQKWPDLEEVRSLGDAAKHRNTEPELT
jgi:hypothetical protein